MCVFLIDLIAIKQVVRLQKKKKTCFPVSFIDVTVFAIFRWIFSSPFFLAYNSVNNCHRTRTALNLCVFLFARNIKIQFKLRDARFGEAVFFWPQ